MPNFFATPTPASPTQFVGGSDVNPTTVANLLANFPPSNTLLGLYARVSDLYGGVDDVLRCRWDGVAYRWVPQRPNYNGTVTSTQGAISLLPLVTPPTLRLTGTLLGNINITPSSVNAYVGMQQKVIQEGTLGLFTSTLTGLLGSNLTLLGNTTKIVEYSPTGWFSAS